jgi:hypothetical protein
VASLDAGVEGIQHHWHILFLLLLWRSETQQYTHHKEGYILVILSSLYNVTLSFYHCSFNSRISMLHVNAAYSCCILMLHCHSYPCCMSMHVHAACPYMSMLHVCAAFSCCTFMLHVYAACTCYVYVACPCCMTMLYLYVRAVCSCYMFVLYIFDVHTACLLCMFMLHILVLLLSLSLKGISKCTLILWIWWIDVVKCKTGIHRKSFFTRVLKWGKGIRCMAYDGKKNEEKIYLKQKDVQ